ncbi:MAG: hypothetical protein FWF10_01225 [Clostridiales bacterium]|nr:hypothetical protein [Clostridiales bacterium]
MEKFNNTPQVVDGLKPDKLAPETTVKTARTFLFLMAVFTAANVLFFVTNLDVMFMFASAMAMLVQILAILNGVSGVGIALSAVIAAVFFTLWFFCNKKKGIMLAALVVAIVDTLCLALFYYLTMGSSRGFSGGDVVGIIYHIILIFSTVQGLRSIKKIQEREEQQAAAAYMGEPIFADSTAPEAAEDTSAATETR